VRIVFFTDTFAPEINGVTNTLSYLQRYLEKCGIEYLVFAPAYEVADDHPPVIRFRGFRPFLNPNSCLAFPNFQKVRDAVMAFGPDVIHIATELGVGMCGLNVARSLGIPAVMSYHTNFDQYLPFYRYKHFKRPLWRYMKWFHSFAEVNLCPSENTRKDLEQRGFANLSIWSRGIETGLFNPSKYSKTVRGHLGGQNKTVFLYAGRMAVEKGLDTLAAAIGIDNRTYADRVSFVFTGDGPYLKEIQDLNIPNAVFTGFMQKPQLSEIYASSDIFVFPSGTETFGNVVLEAMGSGLPVVCTDSGGVTDFTSHMENAVVCKYKRAKSLAKGMVELLNNPALCEKLSLGAVATAKSRSWDSIFDALMLEYEHVAEKSAVRIRHLAG
jgi:glycosyltransferase involved in cell wall biosynthesis